MAELSTATEIATPEDADFIPIRKDGVAGLLRMRLAQIRSFLTLPLNSSGTAAQVLALNAGATALEFVDQTGGGGGGVGSAGFSGAHVFNSATQIANSTASAVAFNSEQFDTNNMHDNSTNNSRLTIPDGFTKVSLFGNVASITGSENDYSIWIVKNGVSAYPGIVGSGVRSLNGTRKGLSISSGVIDVIAGDYFELYAQCFSNETLTVLGTNFSAILSEGVTGTANVGAHRYWGLLNMRSGDGTLISIAEVDIRATAGGADIPISAASASTSLVGFPAANMIDGNVTNEWISDNTESANVYFDLGSASEVQQIAITADDINAAGAARAPRFFDIAYSDDGINYTIVTSVVDEVEYTVGQVKLFAVPVQSVVGGSGSISILLEDSTTARTLRAADASRYIRFTNAAAKTVTIEPEATNSIPINTEFHLRNVGAGDLTVAEGTGVTINVPSAGTLVMETGMTATLKKVATNEYDLIGQTVAA